MGFCLTPTPPDHNALSLEPWRTDLCGASSLASHAWSLSIALLGYPHAKSSHKPSKHRFSKTTTPPQLGRPGCRLPMHPQVRKTAFGSVDAVPHRHFEDPAEAIRALKSEKAFICALETTEGASSLFDLRFPLPPSLDTPAEQTGLDSGTAGGLRDDDDARTTPPVAGRSAAAGGRGAVLEEGGVVALVLGNEVTGVDERVLGLCDTVVEVGVVDWDGSVRGWGWRCALGVGEEKEEGNAEFPRQRTSSCCEKKYGQRWWQLDDLRRRRCKMYSPQQRRKM